MKRGELGPLRVLVAAGGEPWPLDGGGRLHLYNVLTHLVRRAEVTLLLPEPPQYPDELPTNLHVISPQKTRRRSCYPASRPRPSSLLMRLSSGCFSYNPAIEQWLRHNAVPERFDVTMLNGAAFGRYARVCRTPVVWNPQDELVLPTLRDAQFSGWKNWPLGLLRVLYFAAFERAVARDVDSIIYVSKLDASYARRSCADARIEVVQNGVDYEYFRPAEQDPRPRNVVFIGSLEFIPNIDAMRYFALKLWPRIHAADPRRRFEMVGRRPVSSVRELASVPGVKIIPDVPDVRPYLTRASAVVVPIRKGGGLKNKVLEACAARRPVVAHPRALVGLSARAGHDVLCAEHPADWDARIGRLLDCPEYARRIAKNGYDWVQRAHDWRHTGERFYEILESCARRPRGAAFSIRTAAASACGTNQTLTRPRLSTTPLRTARSDLRDAADIDVPALAHSGPRKGGS